MPEIYSSIIAVIAILTCAAMSFWTFRVSQGHMKLIEQAFQHLNSRNSIEATNAISAMEFNRGLVAQKQVAPAPPKVTGGTILKDKITGDEYDILSGEV